MIRLRCLLLCVAVSPMVVPGSEPVATLRRDDSAKLPLAAIHKAAPERAQPIATRALAPQTASTLSTQAPSTSAPVTGAGRTDTNISGGVLGCICGLDTEGNDFCFDDLWCANVIACGSTTDCPSGYRCVANNCCGSPLNFGCFPSCPDGSGCTGGGTCTTGYDVCGISAERNNLCADAILMAVPSQTFGTTVGATADGAPECVVTNEGPGVWYKVVGTGNTMFASTCSEFNEHPNTKISVYCAGCDNLNCVTGNDDDCANFLRLLSNVQWCSQRGVEYLILVHDFSAASGGGRFQLSVWDDGFACDTPPNCAPPPPPVACCLPGGECAELTPEICVERGGTPQNEGSTCATSSCPRDCVDCGPNSRPEGERDCGLPTDTVNGGCNSAPPVFSGIACGESYCGTVGQNVSARDTDWYEVEVGEPTRFTWTVTPEFDAVVGLVDMTTPGSGNCADATGGLDPVESPALCTTAIVSNCLQRGTHWFFVAPYFGSIIECGAEYEAVLTCEPCQLGACCLDGTCVGTMERARCEEGGGTWYADRNCDTFSCTEACCYPDGSCTDEPPTTCDANGGRPLGAGSNCNTVNCPQPRGACCHRDGTCTDVTEAECTNVPGLWSATESCATVICPTPPRCPDNTLYGQPPHSMFDNWSFGVSDTDWSGGTAQRFDRFPRLDGPICDLHWWGINYGLQGECVEDPMTFIIRFYKDAAVAEIPGEEVCAYEVVVPGIPTGWPYDVGELREYRLDLPACCELSSGWVSVQATGGPDCWFWWLSSPQGNGKSCLLDPTGMDCSGTTIDSSYDLSFCLTGARAPLGACCVDSTCVGLMTEEQCVAQQGTWYAGESCDTMRCPEACCYPDGTCRDVPRDVCQDGGGVPVGPGSDCATVRCEPIPCEQSSAPVCGGVCPPEMYCAQGLPGTAPCQCLPVPCEQSLFPTCGGECPPGTACVHDQTGSPGCVCEPIRCEVSTYPTCGGICPPGAVCSDDPTGLAACVCLLIPCEQSGYPACAGECPPGTACVQDPTGFAGCVCQPIPCEKSPYPACGGACPPDTICTPGDFGGACICQPARCEESAYPVCGGVCPPGTACQPAGVGAGCECVTIGLPCTQCGPGPHFIDACGPFPPVGTDLIADDSALVGIDINFDCVEDVSFSLYPCPAPHELLHINKLLGPIDDSVNFPGTSPVDGHPTGPGLDVIDTELVSMCLTNGIITLTAGVSGPSALPLQPSFGAVAEDPTDPAWANSIFGVYFEVAGVPGGPLYNQAPLKLQSRVDCLPPAANFIHPENLCLPLTTAGYCDNNESGCVVDADCRGGSCVGKTIVANLVSASNSVNQPICDDSAYPTCGGNCPAGLTCTPNDPGGGCACEPIPCDQAGAPTCGGACPPDMFCRTDPTGDRCACLPVPCEQSLFPTCGGECPPGTACRPSDLGGACVCESIRCEESAAPACGGVCPEGMACVADPTGVEFCQCEPTGACCVEQFDVYVCRNLTTRQCRGAGGRYAGDGTVCRDSTCECPDIVDSKPSNCAIDARYPHLPGADPADPSNRIGFRSVELLLSPWAEMGFINPSSFQMSFVGPPFLDPPVPVATTLLGGTRVRVEFDKSLPVDRWSCLAMACKPSGTKEVCWGHHPADVDGNLVSNAPDVLAIIDYLNGVMPLEWYQCDVDASNQCNAADVLGVIDLLNGASNFDSWNNRSNAGGHCPTGP